MNIISYIYSLIQKCLSIAYVVFFVDNQLSKLPKKNDVTVSTLLCHRDVIMFICSVKTFFLKSGLIYNVCVTDDGSLLSRDIILLRFFFPAIDIVDRSKSEENFASYFSSFPKLVDYRNEVKNHFFKLDTIANAKTDKVILLDADIIFYKKPTEIIKWVNSRKKYLMHTQHNSAFFLDKYYPEITIRSLFNQLLHLSVSTTFSSGLILLNKSDFFTLLDDNIDRFITFFKVNSYVTSTAEEFLLGLLCFKGGSNLLAIDKYVAASYNTQYSYYFSTKKIKNKLVMFHFGWEVKKYYFENFIREMRLR